VDSMAAIAIHGKRLLHSCATIFREIRRNGRIFCDPTKFTSTQHAQDKTRRSCLPVRYLFTESLYADPGAGCAAVYRFRRRG
jgi:hypothetical protein